MIAPQEPVIRVDLRSLVLPRSGVGVEPPWLVIAPQEPVRRVDLRMLDRVAAIEGTDGRSELLLALGEPQVSIYIADGLDACIALAAECAQHPREQADSAVTAPTDRDKFVFVGSAPVIHRGTAHLHRRPGVSLRGCEGLRPAWCQPPIAQRRPDSSGADSPGD